MPNQTFALLRECKNLSLDDMHGGIGLDVDIGCQLIDGITRISSKSEMWSNERLCRQQQNRQHGKRD